jgi:hypothetical protein
MFLSKSMSMLHTQTMTNVFFIALLAAQVKQHIQIILTDYRKSNRVCLLSIIAIAPRGKVRFPGQCPDGKFPQMGIS